MYAPVCVCVQYNSTAILWIDDDERDHCTMMRLVKPDSDSAENDATDDEVDAKQPTDEVSVTATASNTSISVKFIEYTMPIHRGKGLLMSHPCTTF